MTKKILLLPLALVIFVLLYFFIAILFSIIPVGKDLPLANPVEIFISSNGLHADFIVPFQSQVFDWSAFIEKNDYPDFAAVDPEFIAFGWGDKNFYLFTPSWSDLKFSTAFNALFCKSESVMHVSLLQNKPLEYSSCMRINLTQKQYQKLAEFIIASFKLNCQRPILFGGKAYSHSDNFYMADGSYTLFYTCNTWVNEGLRKINIKTALWTPFEEGIFYHLREN